MINPVTPENFKEYFNANWNVVPANNRVPLISYWNEVEWGDKEAGERTDDWFDIYKGNEINGISLPLGDEHNPLLCCLKIGTSDVGTVEKIHIEFPSKVVMSDGEFQYLFYRRCSAETLHRYSFQCPSNMGTIEVLYFDCLVPLPPSYAGPWKNFQWSDESLASLLNTPIEELTVLDHKKVLNIGRLINSPTVDSINIDLPNDEQFNGRLNRKDSIENFLGKIYRKNPYNGINDTVSQVLDFDLNNYPKASFFLGAEYKSVNREANALIYVAKFNQDFVNENGAGAAFDNKIEDDEIRFNTLIPVTEAHTRIANEGFPEFNKMLIPPVWTGMIDTICEGQGSPHNVVFMAQMCALGACLQGNVVIMPLREDGEFFRRTNLAIAIVADSGSKKSDIVRNALYECKKINKMLSKSNSLEDIQRVEDLEIKIKSMTKQKSIMIANGEDVESINKDIRDKQDELTASPLKGTEWLYENATIQKMILDAKNNQKTGLFIIKDEMKQMMTDFKKKGNEDARTFYMTGIDGNSTFKTATLGRAKDHIENHFISLLTNIQPDVLGFYINQLYSPYGENDGLLQRIQMVPYGESIITRPKAVNFKKLAAQFAVFSNAFYSEPITAHVADEDVEHYITLRQNILINGAKFKGNPVSSVLHKHEGLLSVYGYLFQFLIDKTKPKLITKEALDMAYELLMYLGDCSKYLFKIKDKQEDNEVLKTVAGMLKNRHFKDGCTRSVMYQDARGSFKNSSSFYNALKELELRGYVCVKNNKKNSESVWLNPEVNLL